MENKYHRIILNPVEVEQTIQKSKFITYLFPIQTENEAKERINEVKKLHPKATHHCTAFRTFDVERSNDDGEPASSAGLPMLQVLRGRNLINVVAIVVRYYGGILLGVGGLIRAYGSSVSQAVDASKLFEPSNLYQYKLTFSYQFINEIETHLIDKGYVHNRDYSENVIYWVKTFEIFEEETYSDLTKGIGKYEYLGIEREYKEVLNYE